MSSREDDDLTRDVLRHLNGVVRVMKEHISALASEFDLTLSQLDALKHLEEPCSQRELAHCLHFDASNVTDIVDRLEERDLVSRTIDPDDRRVRRLVLTDKGEAVRRELFERVISQAPLNALSTNDQVRLRNLLAKIAPPLELPF
ncbi:MAG TPA: MarR family transcriptional regulator [Acidimicrobiia bacterium]|nr:MarR family transcriptional regulator [Acidimicrobiia bacterium]